ncbi:glycosyltransferase family protein [Paenibacillus lautus]|uniref:glycosyltransferase family protein n=1 Tax=Paenibacillus lautus TaxID=1401 RepID=UPI003D28C211
MKKLRIGLLHHGNENEIWGSVITTYYLQKALLKMGHDVWRISVTQHNDYPSLLSQKTDLIICEGVPEWQVPKGIWDSTDKKIFWWLSDLFYDADTLCNSGFNAIATNSDDYKYLQSKGKCSQRIDLAVDPDIAKERRIAEYNTDFVYVGNYPHKSMNQMDALFKPSCEIGSLSLWGSGWDDSPYSNYYKGVLPIGDLGKLYKSAKISLLLTEKKQQERLMFNNRVFEVLGSGCLAVSEVFQGLQNSEFGQYIYFVSSKSELQEIYEDMSSRVISKQIKEAQNFILSNHNYDIRANEFIRLYNTI